MIKASSLEFTCWPGIWVVICILGLAAPFGAQPANDYFEYAGPIEAGALISQEISFATAQRGEPQHSTNSSWGGNLKTLWWRYIALERGEFVIDSSASSTPDKALAVYSGHELANLQPVAHSFGDDLLAFPVLPGTEYYIAAALDQPAAARVILSTRFWPAPANDHFVGRLSLRGNHHLLEVSTFGATAERGEPGSNSSPLKSVWFEWQPERTGLIEMLRNPGGAFPGDPFGPLAVTVWQGTELLNLEMVDRTTSLIAGQTYQVQISSWGVPRQEMVALRANSTRAIFEPGTTDYSATFRLLADPERTGLEELYLRGWNQGAIILTNSPWSHSITSGFPRQVDVYPQLTYSDGYGLDLPLLSTSLVKLNDYFSMAPTIPGAGGESKILPFSGSTWEDGEPEHFPEEDVAGGTLWWRWVPSFTGYALVWIRDAYSRVYNGSSLSELIPAASHPELPFLYYVAEGNEYHIVAQADEISALRPEKLVVRRFELPANDNLLDATEFVTVPASLTFSTLGATAEIGEPGADAFPHSVWWRIAVPDFGYLQPALSPWWSVNVSFFQGEDLASLEPAFAPNQPGFVAPGHLYVQASADAPDPTEFTLHLAFSPSSPNDDFAERLPIDDFPAEVRVINANATVEPFEQVPDGTPNLTSLWWEWVSPYSGGVLATLGMGTLQVFQGTALENLQSVPVELNPVAPTETTFSAIAGETYFFQINSIHGSHPTLWLDRAQGPNDSFVRAQPLRIPSRILFFDLNSATREPGEPAIILDFQEEYGYEDWELTGSLWFTCTPPLDGFLRMSNSDSLIVRAYKGTALENLESVPSARPQAHVYYLRQGVTYNFAVANLRPPLGEVSSRLSLNYNFTSLRLASPLPGARLAPGPVTFQVPVPDPEFDPGVGGVRLSLWDSWNSSGKAPIFKGEYALPANTNLWLPPGDYLAELRSTGPIYGFSETRFSIAQTNDLFASRVALTNGFNRAFPLHSSRLEPGEANLFPENVSGSTWFEFVPPADVTAAVQSRVPLAVFKGNDLLTLVPLETGATNITWEAEAGIPYTVTMLYTGPFPDIPILEQVSFGHSPLNDAFANALPFELTEGIATTISGPVHLGSLEPGEPGGTNDYSSAWWVWTAPANGHLRIRSGRAVGIFTGDAVHLLTEIPSRLEFETNVFLVQAGHRYHLRVGAQPSSFGGLQLVPFSANVEFIASDNNDHFDDRVPLSGQTVLLTSGNRLATVEPEEPNAVNVRNTVWYSWTAPADGILHATSISNETSQNEPFLNLFLGEELAALNQVEPLPWIARELSRFVVTAGATYQLRISSPFIGGFFQFRLELITDWPPPNDNFADRIILAGEKVKGTGHNAGATLESGEANWPHENSVWWSWTPPATGMARFENHGSGFYYFQIGTDLNTLQMLDDTYGTLHGCQFWVQAGIPIHIMGTGPEPSTLSFEIEMVDGLSNGVPERAINLENRSRFLADFPRGQMQFEAPLTPGLSQLWWTWTAPSAGSLYIEPEGTNASCVITVFAGSIHLGTFYDPEHLPPGYWGPNTEWPVRVVAGRTYTLTVIGLTPAWLNLRLELHPWNPEVTVAANGSAILHLTPPGPGIVSIETSDDLVEWQAFKFLQSAGETISIQDSTPAEAHKFYRVRAIQ